MYFYNMYKHKAKIYIIYPKYENDGEKYEKIFINTMDESLDKPYISVRSIDINEYLKLIEKDGSVKADLKDKLRGMIS